MEPIISVIVPVYKVEEYLPRCLDSLMAQTLRQIEILLIDDGSPDRCGEICEDYARRDERFRCFHTENRGLSAARNYGIERARGEWLMFVDSDDWVEPDFCEAPLRFAEDCGAELVIFDLLLSRDAVEYETRGKAQQGPISREEAIELIHGDTGVYAWNKLCRRALFADIRFPEGVNFEDVAVTYKLIWRAERVAYLRRCLYHYFQRPSGIARTKTRKNEKDYFRMHRQQIEDLIAWGYEPEKMKLRLQDKCMQYCIHTRRDPQDPDWVCADAGMRSIRGIPKGLVPERRLLLLAYRVHPALFELACDLGKKRVD